MSHTRDKGVPRLRAVSLVTLVASLALWAGLSPTIFVAALFIFLMTVER